MNRCPRSPTIATPSGDTLPTGREGLESGDPAVQERLLLSLPLARGPLGDARRVLLGGEYAIHERAQRAHLHPHVEILLGGVAPEELEEQGLHVLCKQRVPVGSDDLSHC